MLSPPTARARSNPADDARRRRAVGDWKWVPELMALRACNHTPEPRAEQDGRRDSTELVEVRRRPYSSSNVPTVGSFPTSGAAYALNASVMSFPPWV